MFARYRCRMRNSSLCCNGVPTRIPAPACQYGDTKSDTRLDSAKSVVGTSFSRPFLQEWRGQTSSWAWRHSLAAARWP